MANHTAEKVRLIDVAEEASVSVSTASMALANRPEIHEDTRKRVVEAQKRLGYTPLRKRKSKHTSEKPVKRLGYLLVGGNLSDEALSITAHKLQAITAQKNIRLEIKAIEDTHDEELVVATALDFVEDLDGLVMSNRVDRNLIHSIQNSGKPFIITGSYEEMSNIDLDINVWSIDSDIIAMGHFAASHLIGEGHERIAFVCEELPRGQLNYRWLLGAKAAMEDHHLEINPDYIQTAGSPFAGGEPAAEKLVKMNAPPTGYIVPDIRVAAQFITAMKLRGVSVDASSLVLHGDKELARRYQVERYPRIEINDAIFLLAIEKLVEICHLRDAHSYKMLLPFRAFNF